MRSGVYFACGLLLLSGCTHSNWRSSVASAVLRKAEPKAARDRVAMVDKLLDDVPNSARPTVHLLRAQNADSPSITLTSSSAGKTTAITHDAATLALIDKETRSFSPENRERAIATLKAIPSDSVPAVLQLWKAGLISPLGHPTSPVILPPQTASELPAPETLAALGSSRVDPGLGQSSPWPNSIVQPADFSTQNMTVPAVDRAIYSSNNDIAKSDQIQRVNSPVMGFSSPFADNTYGVAGSGTAVAGDSSQTGARTSFHGGGPVIPGDWQTGTAGFATDTAAPPAYSGMNHGFSAETGRQLVVPPEWNRQGAATQSTSTRGAPFKPSPIITRPAAPEPGPANRATATPGLSAPAFGDGPIIRPGTRSRESSNLSSGAASGSMAPERGYSPPAGSTGITSAQVLRPGQALPDIERQALVSSDRTSLRTRYNSPVLEQPNGGEAPLLPTYSGNLQANFAPPELPPQADPARVPVPRSDDALGFLIRSVEMEVGRLTPGQSSEELQYYIERHVYLRLLYLMAGQAELALRPIPSIPAADQEFWTQVLWGVHNYFDLRRLPDHAERAAQTISQFNSAMLRLKERAPLELKHVVFCHQIDGYGEYETYAKDEFMPGQRVLVYAEIANFHSQLSAEGIYRTRLKSTLQVISSEKPDEPVDVKTYPVTEDYCRNHRRDYFHSYVVEIPVRCVRGAYSLKLMVEDELSGKVATYPISFVVR